MRTERGWISKAVQDRGHRKGTADCGDQTSGWRKHDGSRPQQLCSETYCLVGVEVVFPWAAPSQWLSAEGILRQARSPETQASPHRCLRFKESPGTSLNGFALQCEIFPHTLHSFLLSTLHLASDLHQGDGSPSLSWPLWVPPPFPLINLLHV